MLEGEVEVRSSRAVYLSARCKDVDHAARDHVLRLFCIGHHMRRCQVRVLRLNAILLFDDNEYVRAKPRLKRAKILCVDSRAIFDAAILGVYGWHNCVKLLQNLFAHARLSCDDRQNMDHVALLQSNVEKRPPDGDRAGKLRTAW
jgi:hypothetical protein